MALQDTLAGFQGGGAASRNAILQRLGIDPNRAGGYGGNTQFDQQMADLYTRGLQSSASLDTQEGDLNRNYEQNAARNTVDRDRALQTLRASLADRGMSFSGAGLEEIGRTTSDYATALENMRANRDAGITGIGTGRLNLDQSLTSGRQALEGGYGADLGAFLQQQAIDLWNSVTQQNQQNAMLEAMNRPAPAPAPVRPAAAPRPPAPAAPRPAPVNPLGGSLYGGTVTPRPATNLVGRMRT